VRFEALVSSKRESREPAAHLTISHYFVEQISDLWTHLGHSFSSELQPDNLDVPRGINLYIVLLLCEPRLERRS